MRPGRNQGEDNKVLLWFHSNGPLFVRVMSALNALRLSRAARSRDREKEKWVRQSCRSRSAQTVFPPVVFHSAGRVIPRPSSREFVPRKMAGIARAMDLRLMSRSHRRARSTLESKRLGFFLDGERIHKHDVTGILIASWLRVHRCSRTNGNRPEEGRESSRPYKHLSLLRGREIVRSIRVPRLP